MACILDRPSPQALFDTTLAQFSTTVLGGGAVVPESNEWYAASLLYAAKEAWHSIAEQQWLEEDPQHACIDNLVKRAARRGVYPRPASFARGYVQLTGTPGVILPRTISVLFGESYYRLDAGVALPPTMPSNGSLVVRLRAEQPGDPGNGVTVGTTTGRLVTPVSGVDAEVTVYGAGFCGGQQAEDGESFRQRYLARLAAPRRAMYEEMVERILEWPCATRVILRDCGCCTVRGRFDAYVFFDRTFTHGIPPQGVLDDLGAWFFGPVPGAGQGKAPWGVQGQFYAPTALPVDVRVWNLACTSDRAMAEIRTRIEAALTGLTPGKLVCRKLFDAIVVQVLGTACDFDLEMQAQGISSAFCDDWQPACDQLPVPGTITVRGTHLR